jgi:hypothetical protein
MSDLLHQRLVAVETSTAANKLRALERNHNDIEDLLDAVFERNRK